VIARLEAAGVREHRLTEPDLVRWNRFRRKLGFRAFIELLHEDLATAFPYPFDLSRWSVDPLAELREADAEALLHDAARSIEVSTDAATFLHDCARLLDLPLGGSFSELPRIQPQHRVLELPGSGGRIAASLCAPGSGLALHAQFTFVADTIEERVAIGLAAVETRANEPRIVTSDELIDAAKRGETFDRALGLRESPSAAALAGCLAEIQKTPLDTRLI
jgi:hypothetical protein